MYDVGVVLAIKHFDSALLQANGNQDEYGYDQQEQLQRRNSAFLFFAHKTVFTFEQANITKTFGSWRFPGKQVTFASKKAQALWL